MYNSQVVGSPRTITPSEVSKKLNCVPKRYIGPCTGDGAMLNQIVPFFTSFCCDNKSFIVQGVKSSDFVLLTSTTRIVIVPLTT